jgi:DsbC/DsbD-like thiol-disulfide interchange protein
MRRLAACLAALLLAHPAVAGDVKVRLLEGWREADRHVAGIDIRLPPGWHTYWRMPGAAGIAPRFDWSASDNLAAARVEWPHPEVFKSFGMRTIGYHDGVVLPILLTPARAGAPIALDVTMSFGICNDICIPAEVRIAGRLDPDGAPQGGAAIKAALATRARDAAEAGIVETTCRLAADGDARVLEATVRLRTPPSGPQVAVIEAVARPDLWIGEATARTDGATVTAEARLDSSAPGIVLDRSALRLTLIDAARAVDIEGCGAPD